MTGLLTLRKAVILLALTALTVPLLGSSPGCGYDPREDEWNMAEAASSSLSAPQWSPDGARIVFPFPSLDEIYVVETDGSRLETIQGRGDGEKADAGFGPTISPNGSRIAYTLFKDGFEVVTTELDGSGKRALTKKSKRPVNISPAWSPDGTRIALVSESGIVTMAPDGSDLQTVLECAVGNPCDYGRPPVWSPDGRQIAFRGYYGGQSGGDHIFVVGSDGSDLRDLAEGWPVSLPAWSPDGARIAFTKTEEVGGDQFTALYTINPEGSELVKVVDVGRHPWVEDLSWSADGSEIRLGTYPFMAVRPDGSVLRMFTGLQARGGHASWSPDGSRVAVYIEWNLNAPDEDDDVVLFTMAPDGSDKRIVARWIEGKMRPGYGQPWVPHQDWKPATTSISGAASISAMTLHQGVLQATACTGPGVATGSCEPRDVSEFSLFSANLGAGAIGHEETASVEEVLEKGLRSVGASPVHLALRGTGSESSVRCDWRSVARTPAQREEAIRFWLEMDDDDLLPGAAEVERRFMEELDRIGPEFPETAEANFRVLARGGISTEFVFLSCYADYQVSEYLLGSGPNTLTVVYDKLAEMRSYDLYSRAHAATCLPAAFHRDCGTSGATTWISWDSATVPRLSHSCPRRGRRLHPGIRSPGVGGWDVASEKPRYCHPRALPIPPPTSTWVATTLARLSPCR